MMQSFASWLVFDLFQLNPESAIGKSVNFFFYDSIKIILLIFLISLIMGVVNAYFPINRLRIFLTTKKLYGFQYFFASLFGAITPFCSCSSIPLFIGLVKGGIPLGVTFSFLITSPLVNEIAIALFLAAFGWKVALLYTVSGVVLGMIGGFVLQQFRLDNLLTPWVKEIQANSQKETAQWEAEHVPFIERLPTIFKDAWGIVRSTLIYVLVGIGIGAGIYGFVPQGFFENYMQKDNMFAVPLAVICAVPLYASSTAIVPVIQVLVAKGIPLGTAIAFMMSTIGLSLPEATMLKKVMTWKLIGIFFGTVTLFIIISGYCFNIIL